jgi:RNA polymerase sigma-70 factor (ECF subfamily)
MNGPDALALQFEAQRTHLRAVAHRMLGSTDEAEDAVQLTWVRAARSDLDAIENLPAWLTTVVGRICLDMLRSRRTRAEVPLNGQADVVASGRRSDDPEGQAVTIETVSRALLVVLDRLGPAERVAYVLHDLFAVPFEAIADIVGRSPATTKKLASRARARVVGVALLDDTELARHDGIVDAFLTASRTGDLDTLVHLLAPDVVRRADRSAVPSEVLGDVHGAVAVAQETRRFRDGAREAEVAMVDGRPGLIVAPGGVLRLVLRLTIVDDRITEIDVVADPLRLAQSALAVRRGTAR